MKKQFLKPAAIVGGILLLIKSGVIDAVVLFVLAGVVPGTNYSLPPSYMLLVMITLMWLTLFMVLSGDTLRALKKTIAIKKPLPKRRYTEI